MCGIAGFYGHNSSMSIESLARKMANSLTHRGPDDEGVWVDDENAIAIGHRRLSILDLSPSGHQPMLSACGRYVIAFNGEIYNHLSLRKDLNISTTNEWRGHSDTETLLAAIYEWGLEETLRRSVGMFAIALWDKQDQKLYLARDRMGEKPLYYGWCDGVFIFASELKAFRQHPGFNNEIDRNVLALYFRYNYIPAPFSIYKKIYKLEPGCLLVLDKKGSETSLTNAIFAPFKQSGFSLSRWWSLEEETAKSQTSLITEESVALDQLESRLYESVKLQSIADVPLGAFLSGGIDSSLIVALMQSQASIPVRTFTIGFNEQGYDEAEYARAIAEHLGTKHTEFYVTGEEARSVIPSLPELYDEPFADSSQIPTYLVSRLTRQHVTVALSGDAGDELFGGYNRYFWNQRIWRRINWMPHNIRNLMVAAITALSPRKWDLLYKIFSHLLTEQSKVILFGDKLHKLAERVKSVRDIEDLYCNLISTWQYPCKLVLDAKEPVTLISERTRWPSFSDHEHQMMYLDAMTYLPDDILCKVDRAAMGASLETRVPYLDHRVIELAWQLPQEMKIRNDQGKWALRQLLYKYVPKKLIERPKQGFGIPLGDWLRGPLRDWAESLFDPSRLMQEGYLRSEHVQKKWNEHINMKRNWEHHLWSILMFQVWLNSQ